MNRIVAHANQLSLHFWRLLVRSFDSIRSNRQRGDVPGWVLVLLMTAGLVTVMWAVAGPKLTALLSGALDSVSHR